MGHCLIPVHIIGPTTSLWTLSPAAGNGICGSMPWRWIVIGWVLFCGCPVGAAAELLTTIASVRSLSPREADARLPVVLEGVVLGIEPISGYNFFLHDGSGSCCVRQGKQASHVRPEIGDRVRVRGFTEPSGFLPSLSNAEFTVLGKSGIPRPLRPDADQLFEPELDSAWIEVPALITTVDRLEKRWTFDLKVFGHVYQGDMAWPAGEQDPVFPVELLQRPVHVRAVLGTVYNSQHQMANRSFIIPSISEIIPDETVTDSAGVPLIAVTDLLTSENGPQRRVRIHGVVTQLNGQGFFIRGEAGCTQVLTSRLEGLTRGVQVEVQGYGDVASFRPLIRAIAVTRMGPAGIEPRLLAGFTKAELMRHHHDLVTFSAEVGMLREAPGRWVLACQVQDQPFEVFLSKSSGVFADVGPGDRVRLTGICEAITSRNLPRPNWIDGFRILVSDPEAVEVIAKSPWWTTDRLLIALAGLGLLSGLFLTWIWLLRRQVRQQLVRIGATMRSEAVTHERDRMARDLHDTLEQHLAAIALQLDSLEGALIGAPDRAQATLGLTRRMLQHTRLEARRSVWDLRSQVLSEHGLGQALETLVATLVTANGPRIQCATNGDPRSLPTEVAFHLLRMAQEAVANALKHAQASRIEVQVAYAGAGVVVRVVDDGRGFTPDAAVGGDGAAHFGLLGMRERATRIGADLRFTTQVGSGCTVEITWIPGAAV